jgi:integrase
MLRRRQPDDVSEDWRGRQVFPAPVAGGIRDPSNTLKMMREAFKRAGFEGVTSHYFRKTVATLMDEAGLSARSAADQLGHAKPSLTADIYMGRKKRATGAAEVLEDLFQL